MVHSKCLVENQTGKDLSVGGLITDGHAFGPKRKREQHDLMTSEISFNYETCICQTDKLTSKFLQSAEDQERILWNQISKTLTRDSETMEREKALNP